MGAYEGIIGFLLNLLQVAVPPCHTELIGTEMFYFPAYWLNHDMTTVAASLAAVELRVAANMGTDGTGRDAQHQGDFGGVFALLKHLGNGFDILFFHG